MRRFAPWVVAAVILAFLFTKVPAAEAWQALRAARLEILVPAVLGCVICWFWLESAAFAYLFSRFNTPLSWAEARALRGTTYLLTPINWNVGTGAIILHLRRSKRIGALESTSSLLLYGSVDGLVLAGLVLAGAWMLPASPAVSSLRKAALGLELFQIGLLALFMAPAPDWRWLSRVRGLRLFRSHCMASLRDLGCLGLLRTLYFSIFVAIFWLGCHAFGVAVPFEVATASMPGILLSAALPITPAGLGTQQSAMLYFFSPYGEDAAILAFGLLFPVAVATSRCALALRYLPNLALLRRASQDDTA